MSNDVVHLAKHAIVVSLKLYADYQEIKNLETHQLAAEQQKDSYLLPCQMQNLYVPLQR